MRWPTKLKKFGIEDPFLRVLVTKYENEMPWQTEVTDEASLQLFVAEHMLPRLLERVAYPPRPGVKHHFIAPSHVDLELALTTDQELDRDDIEIIRLIREQDGTAAAVKALVEVINTRKAKRFEEWIDFLTDHYPGQAAFHLLLLRPLFDMAGRGSRRTVVPPVKAVADWLIRRIDQGRFTPSEHVGRTYCWKLGAGGQRLVVDGWQYIAPGVENAPQLSAAARGSGWCVASLEWAERYLRRNCFYVLRSAGSPVVALRADVTGRTVVECQGRGNSSPTGWYAEIDLFVRSQEIIIEDEWRYDEVAVGVAQEGDYREKHNDWWSERLRYWPFAAWLAPDHIKHQFGELSSDAIGAYLPFPCFGELSRQAGLSMSAKDWAAVVEIEPRRFDDVPAQLREQEEIREACLKGWRYLVTDDELTLADIPLMPEFVRADTEMNGLIEGTFKEVVGQFVRRPPRNAAERLNRFDLSSVLPPTENESMGLAVERALNFLLNNDDGDFSDERFPEFLTNRVDFQQVRRRAWQEALAAHPPLWFALPKDLKAEADFRLVDAENVRVDLEAWVLKVEAAPWILTQQKGVPKTVRLHRRILEAYRDGWLPYLRSHPYRIWVKRGLYRRVYMSYGLLSAPAVVDALAAGWKARCDTAHTDWNCASRRMRVMPIMQVALLRGMGTPDQIKRNPDAMAVCSDICKLQNQVAVTDWSARFVDEVRRKLACVGFFFAEEVA
jgi:hypothetical protein